MGVVGDKVLYHSDHGDYVAFVTDHEPGREGGDFRLAGFTNDAGQKAGEGVTFVAWSQPGGETGQFSG